MPVKITKSQNLITLSLYKLLKKKKLEDISVTEICKDAGVSRMSFYRSYNSVEDIFIKFSDERFEELYEKFMKIENPTGADFVFSVFTIMKKYSRQLKALRLANRQSILLDSFKSYVSFLFNKLDKQEIQFITKNPLTVSYIAGGFYNVLVQWIDSDFKYTPEEMTSYVLQLQY